MNRKALFGLFLVTALFLGVLFLSPKISIPALDNEARQSAADHSEAIRLEMEQAIDALNASDEVAARGHLLNARNRATLLSRDLARFTP